MPPVMAGYMNLFMPGMVGSMFQMGLTDLKTTVENHGLEYTLLSDAGVAFGQAMGVAFKTGRSALPVPSVFIVDTKGHIRFVHADPKYSQRLDPQVLLAAISMAGQR